MFDSWTKSRPRRVEPRKSRQTAGHDRWREFQAGGGLPSLVIAAAFFVIVTAILMLREDVVAYRPGQYVSHNLTSRVDFVYTDRDLLVRMQERARENEPRVYRRTPGDYWGALQDELTTLPDLTHLRRKDELPDELRSTLDAGDLAALERAYDRGRQKYNDSIQRYVAKLPGRLGAGGKPLVILPAGERNEELNRREPANEMTRRYVTLSPAAADATAAAQATPVDVASDTYSTDLPPEVLSRLQNAADETTAPTLAPKIAELTFAFLKRNPTHKLDQAATEAARERAAAAVPPTDADLHFLHDTVIVPKGTIKDRDWQVLKEENAAFQRYEDAGRWKQRTGIALISLILTAVLSAYVGAVPAAGRAEPRPRDRARGR